ncbi:translation initiation factor IF-2 N-terminal domain-containing protein [Corynebacterium hindlerae]|uniref:Ribonuclease E n=1 Tax=Corynebacterium hindlerae TaxID=699041 RepID=A0A7G5FDU7_9CORY|nr:translation initiation factor IF-2 N-terminal domain-containing protein [Corynebacterium hindlerae]
MTVVNGAAEIDRTQLGEKTRVHVLAKALGITSKELVAELSAVGIKKVAQSSLSRAEAEQVLDALAAAKEPQKEDPKKEKPKRRAKRVAKKGQDDPADDALRRRVEKNVANEISQIEEKVERELAALEVEPEEELLADVEPAITPAPENVFIAPIFKAPEPVVEAQPIDDEEVSAPKRRGRRGKGRGRGAEETPAVVEEVPEEPVGIKGSTRLEAQRRRRTERREEGRKKRHIVSEAEFLARRESVERVMVVREKEREDGLGRVTQVGVLEDSMLVEHFVTSETQTTMVGNIYLGRVQNVLPSMEAAFIDIGKGRNGVLYAGEVDWRSAGLGGRSRKIEQALKSGDQVLVQVTKDPVGHKGARLTTQISLAGRFLVYVPGGRSAGISRKLPEPERKRLKEILKEIIPGDGGAIIRTAAEGVHEREISADVNRLHSLWEQIQDRTKEEKASRGAKPVTMYEEPDMLVKVVRDLFNEDFDKLVVDGDRPWNTVHAYVNSVAPDLAERLEKYESYDHGGVDAFEFYRIDEQIHKALARKVWLPSGGTLVIDRTEAMTVIDVNTGKFTGAGGNLEETVTKNNLEAAEEIVRQMRLRDMGGMIVIDFIDMVLPENQDLVLRRLTEALGRDRTRHQVSEVTSLGLVQVTRKKLGTGLLETFSTECQCCQGRGIILHTDPIEQEEDRPIYGKAAAKAAEKRREHKPQEHPTIKAMLKTTEDNEEQESPSIEELAAAVVAVEEPEKPAKRRRGRRGKNTASEKNIAEIEQIASEAVATAEDADPEEPSGKDFQPAKTYEEALEEYNASPRRRRATRGNSKSDVPPRKADFEKPEPEKEVAETTEVTEIAPPRRGRRRAVKKLATPDQPQEEVNEKKGVDKPAASAPRRGRRRAVKKLSEAQNPAQPEPQKSQEPQQSRGKRRAVRRNRG